MPRATLIPGEEIHYYGSGEGCVFHSSLRDITGHPGDLLDIYDISGHLITQALYRPLSEFDLEKLQYIGEVSRNKGDWAWFTFYRDPDHDQYYVAEWHLSGVDLSGEDTKGGWAVPKEDVMNEPSDEYIARLMRYCHL